MFRARPVHAVGKKHQKKVQEEERASGISPKESQLNSALGDIISLKRLTWKMIAFQEKKKQSKRPRLARLKKCTRCLWRLFKKHRKEIKAAKSRPRERRKEPVAQMPWVF